MSRIILPGGGGAGALLAANNLSDLSDARAARAAIGSGNMWRPSDMGFISWAYDPVLGTAGQALPTAGTVYVIRLKCDAAASITNVVFYAQSAGSALTAGQCFAGLYQAGSLIGASADQQAAWGSTGPKIAPLVGGPFPVVAGDLLVALFFNGTTGPAPVRQANSGIDNIGLAAASSRFGSADIGRTTSFPATLGTIAAVSFAWWAGVS